jgi:hypothetical protein
MQDNKDFPLRIESHLQDLLDERGIREENIRQVVAFAETEKVFHTNRTTGRRMASFGSSNATYWVEYAWEEGSFRIFNAYSHRMRILEGFNMPSKKIPQATDWLCGPCGVSLELAEVKLAYLDETFVADLLSCPSCQRVLITEENAVKMSLAERMLEDK